MAFARAVIACEGASGAVGATSPAPSRIEIVLADGLRLIVDAAVDAGVLAGLIGAIERR